MEVARLRGTPLSVQYPSFINSVRYFGWDVMPTIVLYIEFRHRSTENKWTSSMNLVEKLMSGLLVRGQGLF